MSEFADIDFEDIEDFSPESSDRPDDFMSIIVDKVYEFDWFMLLEVAIAFLVVVSNMYNERVLTQMPGATKNGELTTRGYMMQLVSLLVGSVMFKILFAVF